MRLLYAELNDSGEYFALRYSYLDYNLAVHLPWQDFDPLGNVSLPASKSCQRTNLTISATNLCVSSQQATLAAVTTVGTLTPFPPLQVRALSKCVPLVVLVCFGTTWSVFK
jgi:hypothetical protein